jgi:hypothetical protein
MSLWGNQFSLRVPALLVLMCALLQLPCLADDDASPAPKMSISPTADSHPGSASSVAESLDGDAPGNVSARILRLDKLIMLKCIEMARFNIQYHEAANKRWWWRNYLYPALQEAGTACSLSNSIVDLTERARGLRDLNLMSLSARKQGLSAAVTGNAIGGGSSAMELAQDAMVILMARRHGYSSGDALEFVKKAAYETEEWLMERERLIDSSNLAEPSLGIHRAESHLLRHVRNQIVREFAKWNIYSREAMWRENSYYALDTAQNFTQMASSILSLQSFQSPARAGSASIVSIVGYTIVAVNPAIASGVAHLVRARQRRRVASVLNDLKIARIPAENAEWQENIRRLQSDYQDEDSIRELSFIAQSSDDMDSQLEREVKVVARLRQVADQKITTAPLIGAGNLGRAICSAVAYYGVNDAQTRNEIAFGGRIGSVAAQSYSLVVTGSTLVRTAAYDRRMSQKGKLPSQLLAQRLKKLDDLEQVVKQGKFGAR